MSHVYVNGSGHVFSNSHGKKSHSKIHTNYSMKPFFKGRRPSIPVLTWKWDKKYWENKVHSWIIKLGLTNTWDQKKKIQNLSWSQEFINIEWYRELQLETLKTNRIWNVNPWDIFALPDLLAFSGNKKYSF